MTPAFLISLGGVLILLALVASLRSREAPPQESLSKRETLSERKAFIGLLPGTSAALLVALAAPKASPFLYLAAIAASGLVVHVLYGHAKNVTRRRRTLREVPEMIDLVVRGTEAGQDLRTAFLDAERNAPPRLKKAAKRAGNVIRRGANVHHAFDVMRETTEVEEFALVAATLRIQARTGGAVAPFLRRLSRMVKERAEFEAKRRAITAEARWTGKFLSAFPVIVIAALGVFHPAHFEQVKDSPLFAPLAILVGLMLTANLVYIRIMTRETF